MKIGDIVQILDGSFGIFFDGLGKSCYLGANLLGHRRWKVLGEGLKLPTNSVGASDGRDNDLLVCDVDEPECILFTRARYCKVVSSPAKGMLVTVPRGITSLTLTFEDCANIKPDTNKEQDPWVSILSMHGK